MYATVLFLSSRVGLSFYSIWINKLFCGVFVCVSVRIYIFCVRIYIYKYIPSKAIYIFWCANKYNLSDWRGICCQWGRRQQWDLSNWNVSLWVCVLFAPKHITFNYKLYTNYLVFDFSCFKSWTQTWIYKYEIEVQLLFKVITFSRKANVKLSLLFIAIESRTCSND